MKLTLFMHQTWPFRKFVDVTRRGPYVTNSWSETKRWSLGPSWPCLGQWQCATVTTITVNSLLPSQTVRIHAVPKMQSSEPPRTCSSNKAGQKWGLSHTGLTISWPLPIGYYATVSFASLHYHIQNIQGYLTIRKSQISLHIHNTIDHSRLIIWE